LAEELNEKAFRSTQIFNALYRSGTLHQASNLTSSLIERVLNRYPITAPKVSKRQLSVDGSEKFLLEVDGGAQVETVLIKQPNRLTLCVSSQVGCGMACKFCRTGTMGFRKNLRAGEIIQQVMLGLEAAKSRGETINNIVFMGMGEPLHNFENVKSATLILTDPQGLGFPSRKITISTVGLVPAISRFMKEVPASLAVSLNGTTDEVRGAIMPINKAYPLSVLLQTLREFGKSGFGPGSLRSKRGSITIEYVMLSGVNDSREDLKRLPQLLTGIPAKVNLIPYNENAGLGFKEPPSTWVNHWQEELVQRGIMATIRWSRGRDIDAACGQLVSSNLI
jgi:23S rRNA (adenine2503-C2)-methyltransferase